MRLFVAVDLDVNIKAKVAGIIEQMKTKNIDVKFTKPENLHFTLKFLGEVAEEKVTDVKEKVKEALEGVKAFRISMEGMGYFGSRNFIRVVWIDVKLGKDKLSKLCRKMNVLDYIRKDDFEPNPHLTIGRPRSGRNKEFLLQTIEELKHVKIGEMEVKEVKLKKSLLTPEGPVYSDVAVFSLGKQ